MRIDIDNQKYSTDRIMQLMEEHKELATKQAKEILAVNFRTPYQLKPYCFFIWKFAKANFNFIIDHVKLQKLIMPIPMIQLRSGDCKSFSLFVYGMLSAKGYKPQFKFVSFDNNPEPSHVYVVCGDVIIDGTISKFNKEANYTYSYII